MDGVGLLRWRLTLGAVFVAALFALCWLDQRAAWPGVFLMPLAIVLGLAAAGEIVALMRQRDGETRPIAWVIYAGVFITVLAAGAPAFVSVALTTGPLGQLGWLMLGLAAALILVLVDNLVRYDSPNRAILHMALGTFGIAYVGGLVGFLVQLRLLPVGGLAALASLIATVKMSDTGQYFVGRKFGKHKLAPRVSPGKTWEGVAGGVAFAIAGAALVFYLSGRPAGVLATILYAVMLAAAGIVGDLAESMIKRDAGAKDSSTWMPGFGGVLDMLDSLLVAGPVAYLFWAVGWVGS